MMSQASKRILIVDDEPNIVLALKYLMEDVGFESALCLQRRVGCRYGFRVDT